MPAQSMVDSQPAFYIRDLPVYGDLILAPMDGLSDLPFRVVCRELGSAVSYSEFINAIDIVYGHPHVHKKLAYLPEERPLAFQLFDNDPQRLLEAALRLRDRNPSFIDINLGCSARSVVGRGAGAGLLRTPLKIARIFRLLTRRLDIPVTAKMRLGWDDDCRNETLVARILEENGAALIAVHGRTTKQRYGGKADWGAIARLRQYISIPLVANGDVISVADVQQVKAQTGCQAVMIGRGAIGNPWIFSRLERAQIPLAEVRRVMRRHMTLSLESYGQERGLVLFRKHAVRYLEPYLLKGILRQRLLTCQEPQEFLALLDVLLEEIEPQRMRLVQQTAQMPN